MFRKKKMHSQKTQAPHKPVYQHGMAHTILFQESVHAFIWLPKKKT